MLAALMVIVIGILFILLGWYFWNHALTEDTAPYCWIIAIIFISLGFVSLFNHKILEILFHYLPFK
ncbi:hypothetical protein CVD27_23250 [Neobacillus cucumis]|uniref:Uncharacterized protein n=1 Tax=Neobacillus cucumis TaxID=1740721 RepID=A0A2N5H8L8_9BACI|nr:hypothetical protein CVD27_23250 [Neobacillus cucumis]